MSTFYDYAKIWVAAGKGGDGIVAFLREKFRPDGGPAGGDGGNGGSIVFRVDEGLRTLMDFRYNRHYKAKPGQNGMPKGMYGKAADDLVVNVPPGTIVKDFDTGEVIADMVETGQEAVVAHGGRGGRGNKKFATHNNPAPEIAENGEPGEERTLILELRVLADAGLVGFPSVGKSTLLSVLTDAQPKIGDYPFTTLSPNLGVVETKRADQFVIADLPGLIEGASEGIGLGIQFLRHVERTKVLLHVIDMGGADDREPWEDYLAINQELYRYDPELLERPTIIVANKMDVPEAELYLEDFRERLPKYYAEQGIVQAVPEIVPISAFRHEGLDNLINKTWQIIQEAREAAAEAEEEPLTATYQMATSDQEAEEPYFTLTREDDLWILSGKQIEKDFRMANLDYDESALRFARKLTKRGVDEALVKAGAQDGDIVQIADYQFEFYR
ncbi:MAG: GTPase ObgE [Aerococcus sp.]|nr:GTPase ObgE [Aerococcus sp.]